MNYFDKHQALLDDVRAACRERGWFSPFPETPDKYPGGAAAQLAGRLAYESQLGRAFDLDQPGEEARSGIEVSPYTGEALGIDYPRANVDELFAAARLAMTRWRNTGPRERVGACLEITDRLFRRVFELTHAVMHTTGQSEAMSYAGSGTNALDRGLEALACAWDTMAAIPSSASWSRRFGGATVALQKRYRLEPRGVAVCFTCATFPTWNALPALYASLASGNAVIVKPHPTCVLPMAIVVRECRAVLAECGFDANLVTLALDTPDEPLGMRLVKHPSTAIVDFTGSARFGAWVERNAFPAQCYTETSGVNTVVIDSCDDLGQVARSLSTTLSLFSAQMCTSPQNIYLPRQGIRSGDTVLGFEAVADALVRGIDAIANEPRRSGSVMAAIQSPSTLDLVDQVADAGRRDGRVLRASSAYAHADYPRARTRTPLVVQLDPARRELCAEERFGPIAFLVPTASRDEALELAIADVRRGGGITAFAYTNDAAFQARVEDAYAAAGANLTCNLVGPMPLNFAAAYSDFHVSGLNPAGNATLTDPAFVAGRFRIVQSRSPDSRRPG